MIDWYDKNQCHHNDVNGHDRTNGRIFKVSFGETKTVRVDLGKQERPGARPDADRARTSGMPGTPAGSSRSAGRVPEVSRMLEAARARRPSDRPAIQLRILWPSMPSAAWTIAARSQQKLADPDATIRAWTIQLATEQGRRPRRSFEFAELARTDPSPVVRLYLASALQRLPLERALGYRGRAGRPCRGRRDHNLPLMYWYAAEPLAGLDARGPPGWRRHRGSR